MVTLAEKIAAKNAGKVKTEGSDGSEVAGTSIAGDKQIHPNPTPIPVEEIEPIGVEEPADKIHPAVATAGLVDDPVLAQAVREVQDEIPEHEKKKHLWSTPQSPTFSIHLGGGTVQAHAGVLRLTDAEDAEVRKLIRSGRADIAQNLVYLDMNAAEKKVEEYRKGIKPAAAKGAHNTGNAVEKNTSVMEVKPVEIPGMSEEAKAKLAASAPHMLQVHESDATHADDSALNPSQPIHQ